MLEAMVTGIPDVGCLNSVRQTAAQQLVVHLFDHHPLRPDAVDRLKQQAQQQLLRRIRGKSVLGIETAEAGVEPIECLNRLPPELSQGWPPGIRPSVETQK